MVLAAEEVRQLRHGSVGPEHLLMGMIRDGEGMAVYVLKRLGLNVEAVRADVEQVLAGYPKTATSGEVPFTPQLKRVLELSVEEFRRFQHTVVGTEHLLLGLLKEGESVAARILTSRGAHLDEARSVTLALLGDMGIPFTDENVRFIANSKWRITI
jgi:ATP-dependent Clp protease ATP-binding subunit ClpC